MIQRPNAISLTVCQNTIIEEKTRNVTLVNCFARLLLPEFPSPPQAFTAYAALIGGRGEMTLTLVVERPDTLENIYSRSARANFTDPLRRLRCLFHVTQCSFPVAGRYQVVLLAENEMIAQCVLDVQRRTDDE